MKKLKKKKKEKLKKHGTHFRKSKVLVFGEQWQTTSTDFDFPNQNKFQ